MENLSAAVSAKALTMSPWPLAGDQPTCDVVSLMAYSGNRFLLLKRTEDGFWAAPGGKAQAAESMVAALRREVQEETALGLDDFGHPWFERMWFIHTDLDTYRLHVFHLRLPEPPPAIVLTPKEHCKYRWVTHREALAMPLMPAQAKVLQAAGSEDVHHW